MHAEPVTTRRRNVTRGAKFTYSPVLSPASARRDVSFSLVSTAIQICARTQEVLDHFSRENATIDGLSRSVPVIEEAFGRFKRKYFDADEVLEVEELGKLGEIARTSIDSFNAILPILSFTINEEAAASYPSKRRLLVISTYDTSLMRRKREVVTSCAALLILLLLDVKGRRAIKRLQPPLVVSNKHEVPDCFGNQEYEDIIWALSQWKDLSKCYELEDIRSLPIGCSGIGYEIASLPSYCVSPKPPRPCLLIMFFFATFVALSCFLGVYFTLNKSYGYSMGDAFTLAGWVVAVGAFVSTAVLAYHYPRCECWEPSKHPQRPHRGSYEMLNLAELPG